MKEDAPTPRVIPIKRRRIEKALPHWLREWLERDDITARQQDMITSEIARRKFLQPDRVVGVVVGREGLSPAQLSKLIELLATAPPTAIVMSPWIVPLAAKALKPYRENPTILREAMQDIIREATVVYTFAKPGAQTGVGWDAMRYARHRRKPVKLILQTGEESPLTRG